MTYSDSGPFGWGGGGQGGQSLSLLHQLGSILGREECPNSRYVLQQLRCFGRNRVARSHVFCELWAVPARSPLSGVELPVVVATGAVAVFLQFLGQRNFVMKRSSGFGQLNSLQRLALLQFLGRRTGPACLRPRPRAYRRAYAMTTLGTLRGDATSVPAGLRTSGSL